MLQIDIIIVLNIMESLIWKVYLNARHSIT